MITAKSKYWQDIINKNKNQAPFFTLAPMEAVTDSVFRQVIATAASPDAYYTEFINAKSIIHPKAKFSVQGRLTVSKNEQMPIAQIWGNQPHDFNLAIKKLKSQGYKAIDLNMGCPDSTVIKNGGGSDLIRNPENAANIITESKKTGLPISVKTRLGFNKLETYKTWLPFLLKQDIQVLTIHLRTRKEMSKASAHYELIDDILEMRDEIDPNTLIQFNGDIKNRTEGLNLVKKHPKIDGLMIGRGIFENPWAFEQKPKKHTLKEALFLLNLQLDLYDEINELSGTHNFQKLKRFFKIYVRSFSYASDLRMKLMETNNTSEAREILNNFNNQLITTNI